jgi:hypothetical protein
MMIKGRKQQWRTGRRKDIFKFRVTKVPGVLRVMNCTEFCQPLRINDIKFVANKIYGN